MNTVDPASVLPGLQPVLSDLTERFETRIEAVHVAHPNEIYFHARMDLVPGFCAQLYKKWNGRLVSLFADDARALAGQASRRSGGHPAVGLTSADHTPGAAGGTPAPLAGAFHLYYVFALDAGHGFFILRVPVSEQEPRFLSLTNALPAVNWHEREIQDLSDDRSGSFLIVHLAPPLF